MKNITAVSLIGNEIDIIELFINHTLSIVDRMLVYSHNSFDGTYEYLKRLSENEFKEKLILEKFETFEYAQSEAVTDLTQKAFKEYKADIVIPIDVDEFLVTENDSFDSKNIRKTLEDIDCEGVYKIEFYDCIRENYKKFFVDNNEKYYKENQHNDLTKVIICKDIYDKYKENLLISQGNHFAYYLNDGKKKSINANLIKTTHYNHFPLRSESQVLKKYALGSISNLAKFGDGSRSGWHWIMNLNLILNNEYDVNEEFKIDESNFSFREITMLKYNTLLNITKIETDLEKVLIKLCMKLALEYLAR